MPSLGGARPVLRVTSVAAAVGFPVVALALTSAGSGAAAALRVAVGVVITALVTWRLCRRHSAGFTHSTFVRHPLAVLSNRDTLLERVGAHLDADVDAGPPSGALLYIDLDRFQAINDRLGHGFGDQVLIATADRIRARLPEGAILARISSDEYVVFDPQMSAAEAVGFAHSLVVVLGHPLAVGGSEVFATASVGVVTVGEAAGPEDALRRADRAMMAAKAAGGNGVAQYDEVLHERVNQRLQLEAALPRALERGELALHHQPIVELDGGEVVGFEALLRWERADGTRVPPSEFVPIAESSATIVPIGAWVLHEALARLRQWIDDGACARTSSMSVNVSARQLADADFASTVAHALTATGVPGHQLWLEITETAMITEPDEALACVLALRDIGVRIAVDDFGIGFSSLSLLQRFPLQRLKIDRAFVAGVADVAGDTALVRTIVAMARALNLDLVAEGVETVQQLQVLHDLGCDKAQGYLLSHPLPAAEIPAAVATLQRLGRYPGLRTAGHR